VCSTDNYSIVDGLQLDQPPVIGPQSVATILILPSEQAAGTIQFISKSVTGYYLSYNCLVNFYYLGLLKSQCI